MSHEITEYKANAITGPTGCEWLAPANLTEGMRLSEMMAKTSLVPKHLVGKPEDCFPILVQAMRWKMDPFAVAQCTSMVHQRLCYEGKLVHAVLIAMGAIEGRLSYQYQGEGQNMKITVTGTPKGGEPCSISGSVKDWSTANEHWKKDPQSMLAYRGARAWARLYCPDAMLGVTTPDEVVEQPIKEVAATVHDDFTPRKPKNAATEAPEPTETPQQAPVDPDVLSAAKASAAALWGSGQKDAVNALMKRHGVSHLDEVTDGAVIEQISRDLLDLCDEIDGAN
jgi:hypothetical protein